ncbi:MAG: polysaccharide biosynthesis protein [Polyangiaceae bacterium]|nr:polysaccharide biosynthesis protein [Polyangiaceae bacterium]
MTRFATRTWQFALDLAALSSAYVVAYLLRFDWYIPAWARDRLIDTLPYAVLIQYAAMALMGTHRYAWRYVGLREAIRIFGALCAGTGVLLVVRVLSAPLAKSVSRDVHRGLIPYGIIFLFLLLGACGVIGIRVLRRLIAERQGKRVIESAREPLRTVLVGAGQAGVLVVREAEARADLGIMPVGFVDDDPVKVGTLLHGVPVLGTTEKLRDICASVNATQVLITIARASGKDVRRIVEQCEKADLSVKIIPAMHEIVGGKINLSNVRSVAIEDLLRREPVKLDETAIAEKIRGRVVMITGAGGSIGSELCRQVARYEPEQLLLVERAENALFEIHRELIATFPTIKCVPVIADICDVERMTTVFGKHRPALVFHAAAHKHVPMMEWNPGEAVKNNVVGTYTVATLCDRFKVETFVLISTDKAVNPTSIMGATKRLAELCSQALAKKSKTRFLAVRFGNVLGSAGSVVPIFREQIARGGPVTITHPEMKRYFMTIPEASQLVLQAATMGKGGEIFILDMGEPVKIVDLAKDLITLSGLHPGEDIEIQFTGIRPGEKLFEELSVAEEQADKTAHPKIFIGRLKALDFSDLDDRLDDLAEVANTGDAAEIKRRIAELVPEFEQRSAETPTPPPRPSQAGAPPRPPEITPAFASVPR